MLRTALIAAALLLTGPALAEVEPVGDRVEVNGMQMYYEVSGAGDPLIVLHGAYMNIPSMGPIIPKLAETHLQIAKMMGATVIATSRPTRSWSGYARWAPIYNQLPAARGLGRSPSTKLLMAPF